MVSPSGIGPQRGYVLTVRSDLAELVGADHVEADVALGDASGLSAGVPTATIARRARENGLLFPPDPGAAEQSQLGGNLATNAGGPHAFKYGVTGRWVTGVEAVLAPGELVRFGGPTRKDVAGYDLR